MYIDVGQDGVFDASDRVSTYDWNASGNKTLTAGLAYNMIYMAQEFGGGASVWWALTQPRSASFRPESASAFASVRATPRPRGSGVVG